MENTFAIADTHLHLWNPPELTYPWLDHFPKINRPYGIEDYRKVTTDIVIDKIVFVQCECIASQYKKEIQFAIENSSIDNRIQAIVCWYPLDKQDALEQLDKELNHPLIKGTRYLETSDYSLYQYPVFIKNIRDLGAHNFSFELCTQASQLPNAITLVENCPETMFMLDHAGKPNAPGVDIMEWKKNIKKLSRYQNVYCKLSGLVPEAENKSWNKNDLKRYVDVVLENFGTDRIVFGSDWPVVTLAASFHEWYFALTEMCTVLTSHERKKLFYDNACKFYRM